MIRGRKKGTLKGQEGGTEALLRHSKKKGTGDRGTSKNYVF